MFKYFMKQQKSVPTSYQTHSKDKPQGQALIEYALILVIAFIGLVAILAVTAPAIGNVWSNTVFNLLGQTTTPQEPLEEAEFWELITAVASYTPEAVDLITNTPPNPTDVPTIGPSPTFTPTVPSATPTDTATPGPSPTPADRNFGYPFNDSGDDDTTFQGDNFLDFFTTTWNAEYWSSGACSNGSIFNASTGDAGGAQATATVEKINFPDSNLPDDYWQTADDRPYPGISTDFCSRFQATINLEAKTYTLTYRKDDGVRIYIDGVRVVDDWNWSPNYDNTVTVDWVSSTAGPKNVRIIHRDTGGGAMLTVGLTSGGQTSTDTCEWQLTTQMYRSAPSSWHSNDDLPAEYGNNQYCVLRLRGTIDLSGADNPYLEFFDAYELDSNPDRAIVSVSIAGSGVWNDLVVHQYEENYAFERQSFRLSTFTGSLGTVDYRGQQIELRFVLQTDNDGNTDDGWWVDDVSVFDKPDLRYVIGFFDNVEGPEYWVPNGSWARSSEHVRSGSFAWSDSPGGANYVANADTTLELNGRLDLTEGTVNLPQISFWHSYDLHYYDELYIELSTDYVTWQPLRSGIADTTDYIVQTSDEASFVQEVVDIPASYWGLDTIFVRFRLHADNNTSVDDGWWIDDIEFRNKPQDTIRATWCDDVETGTSNWIPGGTWAPTSSRAYNGSQSWTDSPGANYLDDSNATLELKPYVDMSAPLTRPVFEFWHAWNIERNEKLYVEVSPDDGNSWSIVWLFDSDHRPFGYRESGSNAVPKPTRHYNNNQAWVRERIELSPYIGIPSGAPTDPLGIRIRFRLDARSNSATEDGWYIDAICVREVNDEPVRTVPFAEDFEAGSDNWLMTGTWAISSEETHAGTGALSDSPGGDYQVNRYSYVELLPTMDLTAAASPVLYYFERYDVTSNHRVMVVVRQVDSSGVAIGEWEVAPNSRHDGDRNDGWTRNEVDISAYAGQYIRVRFMLDTLYSTSTDPGWWIDDVQIIDRTPAEAGFQYTVNPSYFEDIEVIVPGEWVFDHDWGIVNSFRDLGSGGNLGPGQWTATWYDGVTGVCGGSAALSNVRNTTVETELNFNWGSGVPPGSGITGSDTFGASFQRTLAFPVATTYTFSGIANDAMRIYDNGNLIYSYRWTSCTPSSTSYTSSPYTFTAGVHNVVVQYYENSGSAQFELHFNGESKVFHDSPSGDYEHRTDTRIELEGEINLAGTVNPVLFWDDRYYIGGGDVFSVQVSTDGGFNWNTISTVWGSAVNNNWTERLVDLSSYAGQRITIRFRIDATSDSDVDDGWYIDNIRIVE